MKKILGGLVLLVALCVGAEEPPRTVRVYTLPPGQIPAAEEAARNVVREGGTVVADAARGRLIVAATEEEHERLGAILEPLQELPKNVRIDVQFIARAATHEGAAGAQGSGRVVVHDGDTHATVVLRPELHARSDRAASQLVQTLTVASGREARLAVGEEVPYLEWMLEYGRRGGVLVEQVRWQRVGAYLTVIPTVLGAGPWIHVRLVPELSGTVEGQPYRVQFVQAATEATVREGETIQVGALQKDEEFYSRFLVGAARGGAHASLDIRLTPHIAGPESP